MQTTTLQNLRDQVYNVLKANQWDSAYPLFLIDSFINIAIKKICDGTLIDPVTQKRINKVNLPFLEENVYYSSVIPTYTSWTQTVWSNTLNVSDTSNFPSSWSLYIQDGGFIADYTWKTSTSFTWLSKVVPFAFLSWKKVRPAFKVPTDFNYSTRLLYNWQMELINIDYRNIQTYLLQSNYSNNAKYYNTSNNDFLRSRAFYTIYKGEYLVIFWLEDNNLSIWLYYQKAPTTLTNWTDICIIPNDYALITVWYLASAEMMNNRWELEESQRLYNNAYNNVIDFYQNQTRKTTELKHNQRIMTTSDILLNI